MTANGQLTTTVLGLDPGTRHFGIAVATVTAEKGLQFTLAEELNLAHNDPMPRFRRLIGRLVDLIDEWRPDLIGVENPLDPWDSDRATRGRLIARELFKLHGVIMAVAAMREVRWMGFELAALRQKIAGKTRASDEEMRAALEDRCPIGALGSSHVYDAMAVAIAAADYVAIQMELPGARKGDQCTAEAGSTSPAVHS